jgi:hypothetical protein
MQVVKKSQYRQRVYQMADGSIVLVFNDDPVPVDANGVDGKVLCDHDISDVSTVTDHVEPPVAG